MVLEKFTNFNDMISVAVNMKLWWSGFRKGYVRWLWCTRLGVFDMDHVVGANILREVKADYIFADEINDCKGTETFRPQLFRYLRLVNGVCKIFTVEPNFVTRFEGVNTAFL